MYLRINDLKLLINVKLARVSCMAYSVLNEAECIRLINDGGKFHCYEFKKFKRVSLLISC